MKSIFKKISPDTCQLMMDMNQKKEATFVLPSKYISTEAAQVGYLLSEISQLISKDSLKCYKSFFCNSGNEAIQGAIKIMRHYGYKQFKKHHGNVLIYSNDPEQYPLFTINSNNLYPNITVVASLQEMEKKYEENSFLSCIFAINTVEECKIIDTFLKNLKRDRVLIGLDLSMIPVQDLYKIKIDACKIDVVIWGEELCNREIPFGAFSMTNKVYSPWNTITNCLIHSSTYSGNVLSLRKLLIHVLNVYQNPTFSEEEMLNISKTYKSRKKAFSTYVNPKLVTLYKLTGYDFNVKKAEGNYLTIEKNNKEYRVFDCVGGGGLSIFGHNPEDLSSKVIHQHNVDIDYVEQLNETLKTMTGYHHFFPSVSGSSAVEKAMILALISQPQKRQKVLVFQNNFAGKLLLPLIGTQPEGVGNMNHYFQPLYENIIVINPFAPDASLQLEQILETDTIGLVWFEYIRGMDGRKIPSNLVKIIEKNRQQYNYYVGVDEILCGLCRTGPLMSILAETLKPDITTLSKGLTYMTFPIGGVLLSNEIYKKADQNNPNIVKYLKTRYQNQMSAQIADHCLNRINKEKISDNVTMRSKQLTHLLKEPHLKKIKFIEQHGLYFNIVLKRPWWTKTGPMAEQLKAIWLLRQVNKWVRKGGIFTFFDTRLLPSLNMTRNECTDLANRIKALLKN